MSGSPASLTVGPKHLDWLARALKLDEAMSKSPALENLLKSLPHLNLEAWPADREVLREGARGDDFFVVYSGSLSALRLDAYGAARALGTLKPGDFFGEISFMLKSARSATVRTETDCQVFRLSAEEFHDLLKRHRLFADWVKQAATERIAKMFLTK